MFFFPGLVEGGQGTKTTGGQVEWVEQLLAGSDPLARSWGSRQDGDWGQWAVQSLLWSSHSASGADQCWSAQVPAGKLQKLFTSFHSFKISDYLYFRFVHLNIQICSWMPPDFFFSLQVWTSCRHWTLLANWCEEEAAVSGWDQTGAGPHHDSAPSTEGWSLIVCVQVCVWTQASV